jgi:hypothetical protein
VDRPPMMKRVVAAAAGATDKDYSRVDSGYGK